MVLLQVKTLVSSVKALEVDPPLLCGGDTQPRHIALTTLVEAVARLRAASNVTKELHKNNCLSFFSNYRLIAPKEVETGDGSTSSSQTR